MEVFDPKHEIRAAILDSLRSARETIEFDRVPPSPTRPERVCVSVDELVAHAGRDAHELCFSMEAPSLGGAEGLSS
jgi:hypothetical protein